MPDVNDLLESRTAAVGAASTSTLRPLVVLLIVLGLGSIAFGLQNLYDDSYERQVVGGDAFNFVIYATRGTAWVCAGLGIKLVAVVVALYDTRLRNPQQ